MIWVKVNLLPAEPRAGLRLRVPPAAKLTVAPALRIRLALVRLTVEPAPVPVVEVMVEWPLFSVMVPNVSVEATLKVLAVPVVACPCVSPSSSTTRA